MKSQFCPSHYSFLDVVDGDIWMWKDEVWCWFLMESVQVFLLVLHTDFLSKSICCCKVGGRIWQGGRSPATGWIWRLFFLFSLLSLPFSFSILSSNATSFCWSRSSFSRSDKKSMPVSSISALFSVDSISPWQLLVVADAGGLGFLFSYWSLKKCGLNPFSCSLMGYGPALRPGMVATVSPCIPLSNHPSLIGEYLTLSIELSSL